MGDMARRIASWLAGANRMQHPRVSEGGKPETGAAPRLEPGHGEHNQNGVRSTGAQLYLLEVNERAASARGKDMRRVGVERSS